MTALQIIIFSFNRALQLDTLVTSLLNHWKSPSYTIDVIYNTSSVTFQKGYEILIDKLKNNTNINFHKEDTNKPDKVNIVSLLNYFNFMQWWEFPITRHPKTNFKSLTIDLMVKSSSNNIMFLTDDAMFINDVLISKETIDWLESNPKQNQISLRIGIGMDDKSADYQNNGEYLSWEFGKQPFMSNWGYRFSVDAHIYNKQTIIKLFKRNIFVNPNTLEGPVCCDAVRSKWLSNGRSPLAPALLSFPINMVQTVIKNETLGVSTETLNNYYLDGYTLKYPLSMPPSTFQQYPHYLLLSKGDSIKEVTI